MIENVLTVDKRTCPLINFQKKNSSYPAFIKAYPFIKFNNKKSKLTRLLGAHPLNKFSSFFLFSEKKLSSEQAWDRNLIED